jgi:hypothetical protein
MAWRTASFAGLMGGDHTAMVVILHDGVDHCELFNVLGRRWPDVVVKELEHEAPVRAMTGHDAADLGGRRRAVEPLRLVIMPQHVRRVTVAPAPVIEPVPVVV